MTPRMPLLGRSDEALQTYCVAGLRGLELANIIFGKPLKYWPNSLWFQRTLWDLRPFAHASCNQHCRNDICRFESSHPSHADVSRPPFEAGFVHAFCDRVEAMAIKEVVTAARSPRRIPTSSASSARSVVSVSITSSSSTSVTSGADVEIDGLALPKSIDSGNLGLDKLVIR